MSTITIHGLTMQIWDVMAVFEDDRKLLGNVMTTPGNREAAFLKACTKFNNSSKATIGWKFEIMPAKGK